MDINQKISLRIIAYMMENDCNTITAMRAVLSDAVVDQFLSDLYDACRAKALEKKRSAE